MSLKLHPIKHTNRSKLWCGPTALSVVTGRTTEEIHACLREVTRRTRISGVRVDAMQRAMSSLGCKWTYNYVVGKPTFAAWLRQNKDVYKDKPVVVLLTNHYVTVMGRMFVDNHTKEPVFLSEAPRRRARVQSFIVVHELGAATWVPPVKVKKDFAKIRYHSKLLALAKVHGISIDTHIYRNEWFVYPPAPFDSEEKDPHYGDHLAYDADERAKRIVDYLDLLGVNHT